MNKQLFSSIIPIVAASIFLLGGCKGNHSRNDNYTTLDGFAQGGTYHIVYKANSATDSVNIPDSLIKYFTDLNKSVNGYDTLSLISQINKGADLPLDLIFMEIFNDSYQIYKESNGAFDISAEPLFNLWGFGFKDKEKVSQEKIDSIMQFVGMDKLSIQDGKLKKADPRMKINFNAIAQGYSCDYIARRFDAMGITDYLLEIGGEIYCKGKNAKGEEWSIAIDKPVDGNFLPGNNVQAILLLSDKGLVTSGNYRKFYIEDGVKYSHTINPKTGYPVKHNLLSASVIAKNATIADAYATYFMVVGLEKSKEILASLPQMDALLVYGEQDNMKVYSTPGIKLDKNYKN